MSWDEAQEWETSWWGNCVNTYGEEEKQLLYANRMGLRLHHNGKSPYNIDLKGRSILDIGGGPSSLLLKTVNGKDLMVIEPMPLPDWVQFRYDAHDITLLIMDGESAINVSHTQSDEVWIYNVLQHTQDPALVVENAKAAGKIIRIFEWINTRINVGHPHSFTEESLNEMLGGYGKVETLNGQANCYGDCYYGIFPTS